MYTVTLAYTPALVRAAVFAYLRRALGPGTFLALGAVVLGTGAMLLHDPFSWASGIMLGATLMLLLLFLFVYGLHYRRSMRILRRMGNARARITLTETTFEAASEAGTSAIPWTAFEAVWTFPGFWLLILGGGQFMTLPLADMNSEIRAFILSRIRNGPTDKS